MSSVHRMWSIALGLVVMAAGSHAFLGPSHASRETRAASVSAGSPRLLATVATEWLPAPDARRDIEQRTLEIDRVARLYGGAARVVDTRVLLRLRSASGFRLAEPVAHFERSVEILGSEASGNAAALRLALNELGAHPERVEVDRLVLQPDGRREASSGF